MSGMRSQGNASARGTHVGGGTAKLGATPNAAGMRNRMASMLARTTPYDAGGGQRPFEAFLGGRAGPSEGQSRADWFAANPNMQRQWQQYRQQNAGGIADWRQAHQGASQDGPRVGLGGHDAEWWRRVGYSPHMVSMLPGLINQSAQFGYGYAPVTDWNDPNQIRRAIQMLPIDASRYSNNGRAMGMNYDRNVWGNWRPGDAYGVGAYIGAPIPEGGGG